MRIEKLKITHFPYSRQEIYNTIMQVNMSLRYTQRNLFETLLNQLEIRLYLPFPINFGSKRMSVWIQPNRKMVNIM